ncbi:MAG: NAD-glutamate dehydrogenase, partial [Steroidobacteraceae bacterium]
APAALVQAFIESYYRGVGEEDLGARSAHDLAGAALDHLALGTTRRRGRPLIRAFNPDPARQGYASNRTLVVIVTDDMPFLVDSLGMVFSAANIAVHLIVHPVLAMRRNARGRLLGFAATGERGAIRESWQLIEIDREFAATGLTAIEARIRSALADVRAAVLDWRAMRARMRGLAAELAATPPRGVASAETAEACKLLDWMEGGQFVFLGYRHYRLARGTSADQLIPSPPRGLGILRGPSRARRAKTTLLRGQAREIAREPHLLVLTKANSMSTVHRATYLDYAGVKEFDRSGRVIGEHRFLGLWTSAAYHSSPRDIPVLRRKVAQVVAHFNLAPESHDAKAVVSVLETYPRDELFQSSVEDLIRLVRGIVNLYERRTVRLLARRDPYGRFYSCMIYVPRDRYTTEVRQKIEQIVLRGFAGTHTESQVQISESNHARVHVIVRTDPAREQRPDLQALERSIAEAATTWFDRLRTALASGRDETTARALAVRYQTAFPVGYRNDIEPFDALEDIDALESLRTDAAGLRLSVHRPPGQALSRAHLKIVKTGDPIPISDLLPIMENFGLRVIAERPYQLGWPEGGAAWVQDFEFEHRDGAAIDIARIEARFNEGFLAVWRGEVENDGFNKLLLAAGLAAREIVVLRTYCRYLLQTGVPFSQASMERALAGSPKIAANLLRLFEAMFDPLAPAAGRAARVQRLAGQVRAALDAVASADDDRILRAYLAVVGATLRTNFYQRDPVHQPKAAVAIKLDPAQVPDLPLPRPMFEIFVYSPRVEGVHLRMAHVARGGIRWSDRRDDFRTEVLGLMKAQNVKNTVIVPAGAKGGFVPKRLPAGGTRDEVQREGIAAYQIFIRSLLDVTDNIALGKVVVPARTLRRDGDDPYLVVAADKGTAAFSDIANGISAEYGFWLGDAFASGGSAGYDHKAMGITARGAWECVKRHFRELGVDTQSQDFTVIGIGDMSGDVFGNGMLLSKHIRLVAAFNHQHVFIDPAPDAARSFAERRRLWRLPRSGWDDYDRNAISRGGGIFARSSKSIALSVEAQKLLGLGVGAAPPNDVIHAILRMPVDLLWNGGIGTYVKASTESHLDVGDRANDAVRINGRELRARVVGEGGNLGLSQRGRVEYALAGGRLNTDFIDNSAGVNTSDVEVNLKILLNGLEREGRLRRAERDRLLKRMTPEVAELVLHTNYLQSQAISIMEASAAARLSEYQQLVRSLERAGELNRAVEFLPSDDEFAERAKRGAGLTRPELSVILSYGKISLARHLLDSDVPEDPYLSSELERYFPPPVRDRCGRAIARHRLRREIIVTATTNSVVHRMGPLFVARVQDQTGAEPAQIARAYAIARESFEMRRVWAEIEALDNRIAAEAQYRMMNATARLLGRTTHWLLAERRKTLHVDRTVTEFKAASQALAGSLGQVLAGLELTRFEETRSSALKAGVPAALAAHIAGLRALEAAFDIVELARRHRTPVLAAARVYFHTGSALGIDWLRDRIEELRSLGPW